MSLLNGIPSDFDNVNVRKQINRMFAEARNNAKPSKCILCGRKQTSFCGSHSVPRMGLKSIAEDGKVLLFSSLLGFGKGVIDIEDGVGRAGTFYCICNECDNSFFQDYENKEKLLDKPTDKVLAEIAVKDSLLQLSKRAIEKELMIIQQKAFKAFDDFEYGMNIKEMDYSEFEEEVLFHKNIVDNNLRDNYKILFWDILPYMVPYAVQSGMALTKDMEGTEINDIYNMNPCVRMQYMHLLIIPFEGKTVVLLFYHKRDRNYRRLFHQFNCISKEEALKYINYLVFKYTENIYISKKLENEILENESLKKLSQESDVFPDLGMLGIENDFGQNYEPVNIDDIPNLLMPNWALEKICN